MGRFGPTGKKKLKKYVVDNVGTRSACTILDPNVVAFGEKKAIDCFSTTSPKWYLWRIYGPRESTNTSLHNTNLPFVIGGNFIITILNKSTFFWKISPLRNHSCCTFHLSYIPPKYIISHLTPQILDRNNIKYHIIVKNHNSEPPNTTDPLHPNKSHTTTPALYNTTATTL